MEKNHTSIWIQNWEHKQKVSLERIFSSLNNAVFEKTMENVRQHGDVELQTRERRNYLTSESNNLMIFWESNSNKNEKEKQKKLPPSSTHKKTTQESINSILDLIKILISDFSYDYIKPKYGDITQLC